MNTFGKLTFLGVNLTMVISCTCLSNKDPVMMGNSCQPRDSNIPTEFNHSVKKRRIQSFASDANLILY